MLNCSARTSPVTFSISNVLRRIEAVTVLRSAYNKAKPLFEQYEHFDDFNSIEFVEMRDNWVEIEKTMDKAIHEMQSALKAASEVPASRILSSVIDFVDCERERFCAIAYKADCAMMRL